MSKFDDWIKELSKTHDVPNAPFVVEAMKAAFIGGRESVLKQWPSDEEIRKEYQDDHERFLAREAIYWLKSRLESSGDLE